VGSSPGLKTKNPQEAIMKEVTRPRYQGAKADGKITHAERRDIKRRKTKQS